MFDSLSAKLTGAFASLRSRGKLSNSDIENTCADIRSALLESDVALSVVDSFIDVIREKSLAALPNIQSGTNQAQAIFEIVNTELIEILGGAARRIRFAKNPPTVIMLAGLQGAGKTTLAGKLA
jgi:signal recognition particle subunit SRP54